MFILDSLMISGIRWAIETAVTAAEAEMNDDSVLREQLLEAEMRRELHEISDEDFLVIEADLLARIREIRERRDGGSGPLALAEAAPLERGGGERFNVEASLAGDFHAPSAADAAAPRDVALPVASHEVNGGDRRPSATAPATRRRRAPRTASPSRGKARTPARTRRS